MKEKEGFISNPLEWKCPTPIASISIDPTRYSHLLVYDEYCQVVVGQVTSPALNKSDAETVLQELKGLLNSFGTTKSKLSAVRYTPASIKIGQCILLSKPAYEGFAQALERYINNGPYPDDSLYENTIDAGREVIVKAKVGDSGTYSWWDLKKHTFGGSFQLRIIGPYEAFYFSFTNKELIGQLKDAVKSLLDTDHVREVKIDANTIIGQELNLRVYKQMLGHEPAICISADGIMGNQRSLVFIGQKSGKQFLQFLNKIK